MTAPTPEYLRELADVLDRCADKDRNAVRVPLLHESAAAIRDTADCLEAVSYPSKLPLWLRRIASKQTSPADVHTLLLAADCLEPVNAADWAHENSLRLAAQLRDTALRNLGRDGDGKNTITGKDRGDYRGQAGEARGEKA